MDVERLVASAQAGNPAARDRLAGWLYVMLDRYLGPQLTHDDDLQDLRQQTCLVVFQHLQDFEDRGPDSFGRWARGIARQRLKQKWQAPTREAAKLRKFAHQPRESTLSLTAKLTLRELEQQLGTAFAQLTQIEREAILWDHESREDDELAALRGVTTGTICTHRHRGFQRLAAHTRKLRKSPLPRIRPIAEGSSTSP